MATCAASSDRDARMAFVVEAARLNSMEQTGGPFAAAVFEMETGRLVSLGVNLVVTGGLSILHAEMVALALAQRKLGSYHLGMEGRPRHELFISAEPCAMCLGAIPWSGVSRVICSARNSDVQAIGFDEGTRMDNWRAELDIRGIATVCDIQRQSAVAVLKDYATQGGQIYNGQAAASTLFLPRDLAR